MNNKIFKSIRVDLYQSGKLHKQVMIINAQLPDREHLVFTRNPGTTRWSSYMSHWRYIVAYNTSWKYGNKDTSGEFFNGFTKVKHDKRWLTPVVYDGAVNISFYNSRYVNKHGEDIFTYTLLKDNYVNHIQRTTFER